MVKAVVGANWGDEGKGKITDMLAQEADTIDGFTFVWFTDGIGWKSARGNLRETFEVLEHVYSIDDMEHHIMREVFI